MFRVFAEWRASHQIQRPLANCFVGLFPALSEPLRCSCYLLRRYFAFPNAIGHARYHSSHSEARESSTVVPTGDDVKSGVVDSGRE